MGSLFVYIVFLSLSLNSMALIVHKYGGLDGLHGAYQECHEARRQMA